MLQDPNNLLGVEYCKALLRRSSAITPLTVRRVGAGYHETISREDIPSAAQIRALLRAGEREGALSRMGARHGAALRRGRARRPCAGI